MRNIQNHLRFSTKAYSWLMQFSNAPLHLLDLNASRAAVPFSNASCFYATKEPNKTDQTDGPSAKGGFADLIGRDFISLRNFRKEELYQFMWTALDLKTRIKDNKETFFPLKGMNFLGIFCPGSVESRLSFDLGISKLGGNITHMNPEDMQYLGGSSTKDAAVLCSLMTDMIVTGGYNADLTNLISTSTSIPVVSAYTTEQHPLQTLSQFITILEYFNYLRGVKVSWVGNGNKVLNSLIYGCAKLGVELTVATPVGYEADPDVMTNAMKMASKNGSSLLVGNDPLQAVYRADAILSGPWSDRVTLSELDKLQNKVSQQGSSESKSRGDITFSETAVDWAKLNNDFKGFQISRKMLQEAGGDWVYMHSLPRHPSEVTDDIFFGKESFVNAEVENRKYVAMALVLHLLQPYNNTIPMPKFVRGQ